MKIQFSIFQIKLKAGCGCFFLACLMVFGGIAHSEDVSVSRKEQLDVSAEKIKFEVSETKARASGYQLSGEYLLKTAAYARGLNVGSLTMQQGSTLNLTASNADSWNSDPLIVVQDFVILHKPTLELNISHIPSVGEQLNVLELVNAIPIEGAFYGWPEGAIRSVTDGTNTAYLQITYTGGDGNDIVLTAVDSQGLGAPGKLTIGGNLTLGGTLLADSWGTDDDHHDMVVVGGEITLLSTAGLTLRFYPGYTPQPGDALTIMRNDGPNPISGEFSGFPEGSTFSVNGVAFYVTYKGGDGNDFVIETAAEDGPAVLSVTPSSLNDSDVGEVTVRITFDKAMDTGTDSLPKITGLGSSPYTIIAAPSPWSSGDTVWTGTFTLTDDNEAADGTYYISGFRDAAGGLMEADVSHTVSVDTQAPNAPSVPDLASEDDSGTFTTDNITNRTTGLTISGTAEANATVDVFAGAVNKGTVAADGSGNWSLDISLEDGDNSYSITAAATDAAGNISDASDILTIEIDTTAPAGYSAAVDQAGINAANQDAVSITISDGETGTLYSYSLNDTCGTTAAVADIGTIGAAVQQITGIDLSGLDDDMLTLTVTLTDVAGNAGTAALDTVLKDTGAPGAPTGLDLAAADDSGFLNNDNITRQTTQLTISGIAEANASVTLYQGAVSKGTATADASGNWSMDINLEDGDNTCSLTATAADAVGNVSASSAALDIQIDTAAPADPVSITVTDPVTATNQDSINAVVVFGAAPENGFITLRTDDGTSSLDATAAADTSGSATLINAIDVSHMLDGPLTVTAAMTDIAGNINVGGFTADAQITKSTATYTITPIAGLSTAEDGATAQFTIVPDSSISADLTIALSSSDETEGTVSPSSLTFTPANWNTPQTVTVTGVDDTLDDGDVVYSVVIAAAVTTDPDYNEADPADLSVTNIDNDGAGITVTPNSGLTTTEAGDTDQFTVVLNTAPAADVTIALSSSDDTEGAVSPASLTFTPADWNDPQTVIVTGVDDDLDDGDVTYTIITAAAVSADSGYSGTDPVDVSVTNTGNDGVSVLVVESGSGTSVTEGSAVTDTYSLVLTAAPGADVTVSISSSAQIAATPSSLLFTADNWNTPQSISVRAADDAFSEGSHTEDITHTVSSTDDDYDGIAIRDITVTITDNDSPGVSLVETGGNTRVSESGAKDTYSVVLMTRPSADAVIRLTSIDELVLSPNELTFTSENWNRLQTVSVSVLDNSAADGTRLTNIQHSITTTDSDYNSLNIPDIEVRIEDDDSPSVLVTESGGSTSVSESGNQDTYTIALATCPAADVTVIIGAGPQLSVDPESVTFTVDNWSSPRIVTVNALDDTAEEGGHNEVITHQTISADTEYDNIPVTSVIVTVSDNDGPGLIISENNGTNTLSPGESMDIEIVLSEIPAADVNVGIEAGAGLNVNPQSLAFTPVNWNTVQVLTVTAVSGTAPHASNMSFVLSSTDPEYDGLSLEPLTVLIESAQAGGGEDGGGGSSGNSTFGGSQEEKYPVTTSKGIGSGCFIGALHQ